LTYSTINDLGVKLKKHWNTIYIDGSIDEKLIFEWIDNSYDLIVNGLTKKLRDELLDL